MGRSANRGRGGGSYADRREPLVVGQKSLLSTVKEVEEFVTEPAPKLRRCGLCPALLRSGNKSNPPRCSVCEKKFPGRRESE
jgi:hypothetical protein